jgi:hypothetical protein
MTVQSLFLCAYKEVNRQSKSEGKYLVLQSIDVKNNEHLFLEPTQHKKIRLLSTDRFGIDLELTLVKKSGSIHIDFHKKKTCHVHVWFSNAKNMTYSHFKKGLETNVFLGALLSEFPDVVGKYTRNYNKKWKNISNFAFDLIQSQSKKCHISIGIKANENKIIAFNEDPILLT